MLVKLNIWWKRDECAIVGRAVYSEDDVDWTTAEVADGHSQGSILELRILELRRANHLTSVFLYTWPHCTIWLLWFKCKNLAHVTHMVTQCYISVYFSVFECQCVTYVFQLSNIYINNLQLHNYYIYISYRELLFTASCPTSLALETIVKGMTSTVYSMSRKTTVVISRSQTRPLPISPYTILQTSVNKILPVKGCLLKSSSFWMNLSFVFYSLTIVFKTICYPDICSYELPWAFTSDREDTFCFNQLVIFRKSHFPFH